MAGHRTAMSAGSARSPHSRTSSGQVLVLFALSLTVLLGAAGLAFDVGRFYMERRFLQNAADAAALAGGQALAMGMTDTEAIDHARTILQRNLAASPNGVSVVLPPTTPVYESGYLGQADHLTNGILVSGGDVRVAILSSVNYTLGRIVGLDNNTVGARAHVTLRSDLLPIAVRQFLDGPGPNSGPTAPCTSNGQGNYQYQFEVMLATADTTCLGTETDASLRTDASPGMAFDAANPNNDPSHHGPIRSLVGEDAASSNNSAFQGFVVLDIRNFAAAGTNVFYNGVTPTTPVATIDTIEAGWVATGYPGPAFPAVISPPDPNDQVGLATPAGTALVVAAIGKRFRPGDEIVAPVYSGTVMTIPDFAMPGPTQPLGIGTTQTKNNTVSMSVTKNAAFSGQVTVSALTDVNDVNNPLGLGTLLPITFSPNPATPAATVSWTQFKTVAAVAGIYTIWVQGHSSSPYLTDHFVPVAVNVGAVARDFGSNITPAGASVLIPSTGGTASLVATFKTTSVASTYFGGAVNLSLEGGPPTQTAGGPAGIGTTTFSANNFTLNNNGSQSVTITLSAGSLAAGRYNLAVRATGTNLDGKKVTHLYPITLDVATAATSNNYVDIAGFAAFRITAITSTDVMGYAISPLYADMNDVRLRRVQAPKLSPWS